MEDNFTLFPIFEEEARLFGMSMSNFINFAIIIILEVMAPMLLGAFGIELGFVFITTSIVLDITLWILLKNLGKKAYPNFVFAWLSYKLMQPHRITCESSKFSLLTVKQAIEIKNEENKENEDRRN